MLSRSQRMSGRQLIEVLKKGRILHSPFFIMRVLDENKPITSRLAAVVPVKIGKTSATRHLVRRRIYEAARPFIKKLGSGRLIILFAKLSALKTKPAAMQTDIGALFVKADLLR